MAYASLDGGLRSLFQTDRRQGAISEGVAKLWQDRAAAQSGPRTAPSYFPRSGAPSAADSHAPAITAPVAALPETTRAGDAVLVPLPPRRPADLAGTVPAPTATFMAGPGADRASAAPVPASQARNSLFDPSSLRLRNGS